MPYTTTQAPSDTVRRSIPIANELQPTLHLAILDEADKLAAEPTEWTPDILARLSELSDKQQRFCLEYLVDFNQVAAAKRAGYAPDWAFTQASRLMRHPRVGTLIAEMADLSAEQLGISRAYVLSQFRQIADEAREEGDRHGAVRALEMLAKLRGDMIERKQVDVRTVAITINDVDMEDLR